MQILKEILDRSAGLTRLTISELNAFTEKDLGDISSPRLIVCDRYPEGDLLAVLISWEDWRVLVNAIGCAERAALALSEEFSSEARGC